MDVVLARTDRVAVVGAGAAGILTAVQLLRHGAADVTLLERNGFGGVAYRTAADHHLLNVRADAMSGLAHDADSFARWARRQGVASTGEEFLPRRLYRLYLADLLRSTAAEAEGTCRRVDADVLDVMPSLDGVGLLTQDETFHFDRVVLALGNGAPAPVPAFAPVRGRHGVVEDPWSLGALMAVDFDAPVVVVGTGLTATDIVLELGARGHRGPITMVSRRGLLPLPHCERPCPVEAPAVAAPAGLNTAIRQVDAALQAARAANRCWHGVVDGLRPVTADIWAGFSVADKDRFLRQVRPWWERRRHRVAPAAHASLRALVAAGQVHAMAGTIDSVTPAGGALQVSVRCSDVITQRRAGLIVNCTGPAPLAQRHDGALLPALIANGTVRTDRWGLGLETDASGAVVNATGRPWPTMYAIGPLRRGTLYESTAIPEIRDQAATLAPRVLGSKPVAVKA